jgi:two-component system sensor histidine kinase RegB
MAHDLEPAVTLPWLVRLRWVFLAGQIAAVPITYWWFGTDVVWLPLTLAIAVFAASNVALAMLHGRWPVSRVMGVVLVFDTAILTALLAAFGGATNPFTVLYLVHITLSAVVLSARWITVIAIVAVAGFATLFAVPFDPHEMHRDIDRHLQGMWAAFVLAAALIAFFVRRISTAIATQRQRIAALQEAGERNARLASLTTLAAGAAHELNSPLATIAVAAYEAERRLATGNRDAVAKDLQLILLEVDRCKVILDKMAARADDGDAPQPITLERLSERIRAELGEERAARVELRLTDPDTELVLPSAQAVQSIVALIRNALDASATDNRVVVDGIRDGGRFKIVVQDRGAGISPDVLSKVGEPFFTTKQPGAGLGLGVFLARAFVESLGGTLAIDSTPGVGTRAVIDLPLSIPGGA